MTVTNKWLLIALVSVGVILVTVLIRRMHNLKSNINLDDLIIDPATNRISKAAAVLMGAFGLSSWVIIYLTVTGKFDNTAFAAYLAAFAIPAVTKIITDSRAPVVAP